MKYKEIDDLEINGDRVLLKINEKVVEELDIEQLVDNWLHIMKNEEFIPINNI